MRSKSRPAFLSLAMTCLMASVLYSQAAFSADERLVGKIVQVLVTSEDNFGGCMAYFNPDPQTVLPTCGKGFLSFSCSGEFADPERAYKMLTQAQLGMSNGTFVQVDFTDEKKHNGYCVAYRIDTSNVK